MHAPRPEARHNASLKAALEQKPYVPCVEELWRRLENELTAERDEYREHHTQLLESLVSLTGVSYDGFQQWCGPPAHPNWAQLYLCRFPVSSLDFSSVVKLAFLTNQIWMEWWVCSLPWSICQEKQFCQENKKRPPLTPRFYLFKKTPQRDRKLWQTWDSCLKRLNSDLSSRYQKWHVQVR